MFKKSLAVLALLLIVVLLLPACSSTPVTTTATVTATATTTVPPVTQTATVTATTAAPPTVTVTTTATVTVTPTPTTPVLTAIPASAVTISDPTGDMFDKNGGSVPGQPFLDIVSAAVWIDGSDYVARITLNGDVPLSTTDLKTYYEYDIFIDADKNATTGDIWNIVHPGLGAEYLVWFGLQGGVYGAQVQSMVSSKSQGIVYTAFGNTLEFRWPVSFFTASSFNFTVTTLKFGERMDDATLQTIDKTPNTSLAQFPKP
jgi:hypothetical protein